MTAARPSAISWVTAAMVWSTSAAVMVRAPPRRKPVAVCGGGDDQCVGHGPVLSWRRRAFIGRAGLGRREREQCRRAGAGWCAPRIRRPGRSRRARRRRGGRRGAVRARAWRHTATSRSHSSAVRSPSRRCRSRGCRQPGRAATAGCGSPCRAASSADSGTSPVGRSRGVSSAGSRSTASRLARSHSAWISSRIGRAARPTHSSRSVQPSIAAAATVVSNSSGSPVSS